MHTGVISFCDRVAYNIKSSDTKDDILRELEGLFQIRILQKHWYPLTPENVAHVYRAPHLACLRSNGNPYYMYFTRYEDVPIIYFIDKKVQPGYQKPRIILGRGMFDDELFSNTLIEGEMVKDVNAQWLFMINDVIAFENKYLSKIPLPKRLEYAYRILKSFTPDPIIDFCSFQVKRYCYASREGLDFLLQLSQALPYTNRGLYYWPFYMQYKPKLYNFDSTVIKEVHRKVKDNPEFRQSREISADSPPSPLSPPPSPVPVITSTEDALIKWLRKTENPDIYNVYETQTQAHEIGTAYVSSLTMSKKLRSIFKDLTVTMSVAFKCKFNEKFNKYQPIDNLSS